MRSEEKKESVRRMLCTNASAEYYRDQLILALDEIERLQEENEQLKDLIGRSAPLLWVNRPDCIEHAHRWEIEASKLLGLEEVYND